MTAFINEFDKEAVQLLKKYKIPGGAFVIVKGNEVIKLTTYGVTDSTNTNLTNNALTSQALTAKQAINQHTVFRLASVSKTFAATLAVQLAEQDKLILNKPITDYVPNFKLSLPNTANQINLQHLLSHTAGLMPNSYDNLLHENWSLDKIISRFNKLAPICQPGECYGYQNIAYSFIQQAIESEQPLNYSELMQKNIFSPLNMTNASLGYDAFKRNANTAKPHVFDKKNSTFRLNDQGKRVVDERAWKKISVSHDYYKVLPAAGVNASITDLAKWLNANLGHKPNALKPQVISELTTKRIKTKRNLRRKYWRNHLVDAHYGYGWRIYQLEGLTIHYHAGWVAGFRADIGYSPKHDIGFAILINSESNVITEISSSFWSGLPHD